jgi:hypothetical protein
MNNHYIKIDNDNNVIEAFSDAFKKPDQDSILIFENAGRHCKMKLFTYIKPDLFVYNYYYQNEKLIKKDYQEIQAEIDALLNTTTMKKEKLDQIRVNLLNASTWINSVWTAQEYGHSKGINLKDRLITEQLYDDWVIWFEKMSFLSQDIDLKNYTYDEIDINNTNIFPVMPDFPGDFLRIILNK